MKRRQYTSISRAYAQALFSAARKQGVLARIRDDAEALLKLWADQPKLRVFLEGPQFSTEAKRGVLDRTLRPRLHPLVARMLELLVQRERAFYLESILDQLLEMIQEAEGLFAAQVRSARELSAADKTKLQQALEKYTKCRLQIEYILQPNLLGGLVFRFRDIMIDGSLRNGLEELRQRMTTVSVTQEARA